MKLSTAIVLMDNHPHFGGRIKRILTDEEIASKKQKHRASSQAYYRKHAEQIKAKNKG
jgi:hypothetical protein